MKSIKHLFLDVIIYLKGGVNVIESLPWIWAIVIVATLIIEFFTADIDVIWFSIGALVSLVLSVFKVSPWWQVIAFLVTSGILIFTVGRWARRVLSFKKVATNVDSLIGREIMVLEDASEHEKGSGIINDVVWTIMCQEGEEVRKGQRAFVVDVRGNKLVVKNKHRKE